MTDLLYLLDLAGVGVFAISGTLAAGRKGLDWLGVMVIAMVTAIGGGTLRDLLLDRHPIFWFEDVTYLVVIFTAAFGTLLYVRHMEPPFKALLVADAIGLALFTLMGTQLSAEYGLNPAICVILGTITGVAGGLIRDILSNDIPLILKRDIYATAAILGATFYLVLNDVGVPDLVAFISGMVMVIILRLLAIIYNLRLPVFILNK